MLHFLSFQSDRIGASKDFHGRNGSHCNCTNLADTTLVPAATTDGLQTKLHITKHTELTNSSKRASEEPPAEGNETGSLPCVGKSFESRSLSKDTQAILLSSWRESTKKQYRTYIEKWMSFCYKRKINIFEANVDSVLTYLTELYNAGLGYSCINTARSALSSFLQLENCVSVGSHPLVRRFMKGVFNLRPSLPRYNVTWDVNIVLKFLKNLTPISSLSLLKLSQKLLMLLALLSGQRGQTLHLIDIRNIHLQDSCVKIVIGDLLKTSDNKKHLGEINLSRYDEDTDLCVMNALTHYLQRTEHLRALETKLFITTQRPHKPVSRDTIGRWLKSVMKQAGIDVSIFKPHSMRAASTNAAYAMRIPVDTIIRTVGWSKDSVFRKFYKKPVSLDVQMSKNLLNNYS